MVDKLMTSEEYSIDPDFSILFPLLPVGRSGLWHFLHCNSESVEKKEEGLIFGDFLLIKNLDFVLFSLFLPPLRLLLNGTGIASSTLYFSICFTPVSAHKVRSFLFRVCFLLTKFYWR